MTTKLYTVTDPDAVWAGGERVSDDRTVRLTDEQARYELLSGAIAPAQPQEPRTRGQRRAEAEG